MSRSILKKWRHCSCKTSHSKKRPLCVELLEPRIALSGEGVVELAASPGAPAWVIEPYALSDTSISMTVQQQSGLEYYFHNVTDTSHDSGWITGAADLNYVTYVDQNLTADAPYRYEVKARDPSSPLLESAYSSVGQVSTMNTMAAAVQHLANQIRAVETFSNPENPGQITGQLVKNGYPNPQAINNNTTCEKSGTNGLSAYPGDGRNTPGAFQVDLANMGQVDPNNPVIESFGQWKGTAASAKTASMYDTQIALSKQTLHDYFHLEVDAAGLITHIEAPAASVFLHDDALATSTTWNPDGNPLVGLHIDNFQPEQLSLYLAGRDPDDGITGVTDTRTSPAAVMHDAEALQDQVSKSFMWATYQKYLTHDSYKATFAKVVNLYGATLEITSSQKANIFGINQGDMFKCRLTPAFVLGGAYVSGEGNMFNLLTALVQADDTGAGTWSINGETITFQRKGTGTSAQDKVFTVDKTPMNNAETYPSIFHYGAVLSPYGMVDYKADPTQFNPADLIEISENNKTTAWGVTGRTIKNGLGYERLTYIQTVSETQVLTEGGRYNYLDLEQGKLTLTGKGDFVIMPAVFPKLTTAGYMKPSNNSQTIAKDQTIDVSNFFNTKLLNNNEELLNSSFYVWWDKDQQSHVVRVNDPSFDFSQVDNGLFLYIAPAAQTPEGLEGMKAAIKDWAFGGGGTTFEKSARVMLATKDVFGKPGSADAWAAHFTTQRADVGTGEIDASMTEGKVLIVLDGTITTVKLGSGCNIVLTSTQNTTQKTFALNPNAKISPTLDIRSGDIIDWKLLPQDLTWTAGTALTYDCHTERQPNLRYSYFAGWTGTGSATATFQAIVRANGNTGTSDPVEIVNNALKPLGVTLNRASAQAEQTGASLLNYTVVFSEAVSDFTENDVILSGPPETIDGARIVVANPSGDKITYSVAITLKDTAAAGVIIGTIGAGEVHDLEGFSNLASTGTSNVNYMPNAITGQGNSNVGPALAAATRGGEPLPGVRITLQRSTPGFTERTATTDGDGYYQFENVPDGVYQVTVTPPNACINSGSDTTVVSAEGSQTYQADFSTGALKPGYIPNRMMVTSSLPVGSTQWRQVVREALNLGEQAGSQGTPSNVAATSQPAVTQYLTLTPQTASLTPNTTNTEVSTTAPVNTAQVQAESNSVQITQTAVAPIVQEAVTRWAEAGLEPSALNKMQNTRFVLSDLAGAYLGMTQGSTVWLDGNAAGRGWFVDSTPDDDQEFDSAFLGGPLRAVDSNALDQVDLLTVISHELGHVAGLKHSDVSDLMGETLATGLRLTPSAHDVALASI
ncbi:MAG: carboxypeptidase regulatory-like domain-containing protein [Pirellulales bacterium]|nr:carboxypeptidase regulatory-like domain-containing protein [Pirellulales bacterium]